jgi:hypothetical protein
LTETLFNIGDVKLSGEDVCVLALMMGDSEHTYQTIENEAPWVRKALSMLVIEGIIERSRADDGMWLNEWRITSAGVDWTETPEIQADIALANGAFGMFA